jgi:hypothetical protein
VVAAKSCNAVCVVCKSYTTLLSDHRLDCTSFGRAVRRSGSVLSDSLRGKPFGYSCAICCDVVCEANAVVGQGDGNRSTHSEREETVDLSWLVRALDHARSRNQTGILDYLQWVEVDVVFETENAARRASLLTRLT